MHFISRNNCPAYLSENKATWTIPWVAHYRWQKDVSIETEKPPKPSDGYWRDNRIRLVLMEDYKNNCGYCGALLPTPQYRRGVLQQVSVNGNIEFSSKGDVDHMKAKARQPELTYEWLNYVWSCKPCNQHKGEFHSSNYPLLNPNVEDDCTKIGFIEDTGQYTLIHEVHNNATWKNRFKNNEKKTLINSVEHCKKRKLIISMLHQRFESTRKDRDNLTKLNNILIKFDNNNDAAAQIQSVIDKTQVDIDVSISEIKAIIDNKEYYFLVQKYYQLWLLEYPEVAGLLI